MRDVTAARPGPSPDRPDPGIPAIRTVDLRKEYRSRRGQVEAVRGIDLQVPRGQFFGLLGPNGAGKSTTIGMLSTLVIPSAGIAQVAGYDVVRAAVEVKRRIGVVSQANTLDRALTVEENLEFRGRFFDRSRRAVRQRTEQVLAMLELSDRRRAMVYELSGGQERRLMIGRALMHRPQIMFLDEPTAGIDPQARLNVWDVLRGLHADGLTLVLTTHYLDEAEELCEYVAIIDHGQILAAGTPARLTAAAATEVVITVRYGGPPTVDTGRIRQIKGVSKVEVDGNDVRVWAAHASGALVSELVAEGAESGQEVRDVSVQQPSLENAFIALTGREYRE